jgi:predicted ABC-type ATPase
MWYAGLSSPGLHVARVRARVAPGGHDVPEEKIRERYDSSRADLILLLPRLTVLQVYDNSAEGDPASGKAPRPLLVPHMERGRIRARCANEAMPDWAKPIVVAALRVDPAGLGRIPKGPPMPRAKRPRRPPR